ncbi:HAD family phosphatase [uncultured Massilia sp.]|uniref:HAD family hydrolase n=1 Tax=uncultured Massilia sp. TaxID=169973 RepID=UPI0025FBDD59|nr:HAD family phosphatase [uncultured Massilia sp.]
MATGALKAILWDNDGVLSDTERLFFEANRRVLAPHGIDLAHADYVAWYLEDARGAWHLLRARGYGEDDIAQVRRARDACYAGLLAEAATPLGFPGVPAMLARLAPRVAMSIVTASFAEHVALAHRDGGVLEHIGAVFARAPGMRPKPHPDAYLHALQQLGLDAADCIAVEDSPRGLAAARAAGLRCIALRSELLAGYDFDGAWRVVDGHAELERELALLLDGAAPPP